MEANTQSANKQGLKDLPPVSTLEFTFIQASEKSGYKKGDKINIKGADISDPKDNNKCGLIGRAKTGQPVPEFDFRKDNSVSSATGELHYRFNQFGIKTQSKGNGVYFQILKTQKYQILPDMLYKADGSSTFIQAEMVYPNQPVTGKDQAIFSTIFTDMDEATVPLSSFQGQIKDMSKAQLKIKLVNPKNKDENEKEIMIQTDNLTTSKTYTLGSDAGCDIVVAGIAPKAATFGYSAELKAWYVQSLDDAKRVFQSQATFYQKAKSASSSFYRLANGMVLALGGEQSNTFSVRVQ